MAANNGQNEGLNKEAVAEGTHGESSLQVNQSRRRFGMAGIAASGVLLTLTSRSALSAGEKIAQTPSAYASNNKSHHGEPMRSQGGSPGFWSNKNGQATWDTIEAVIPRTSKFNQHFNCPRGSVYYGKELQSLLPKDDVPVDDRYNLGRHFVAALLNCKMGWTDPYLPETRLKEMYSEWQLTGQYKPSATAEPWLAPKIVEYLESTMGR